MGSDHYYDDPTISSQLLEAQDVGGSLRWGEMVHAVILDHHLPLAINEIPEAKPLSREGYYCVHHRLRQPAAHQKDAKPRFPRRVASGPNLGKRVSKISHSTPTSLASERHDKL